MLISSKTLRADLVFVGMTLIWGLTFPLIRTGLQGVDPLVFVSIRFAMAVAGFLPLLILRGGFRRSLKTSLVPGLWLGLLVFITFLSQTIGLMTLSSGRAAFITSFSVLFVPILSPVFGSPTQRTSDWIAIALAAIGLYWLTDPRGGGVTGADFLVLICAISASVHTHLIQKYLVNGAEPLWLAFYQVLSVSVLTTLILPFTSHSPIVWSGGLILALMVCSVFATVITFVLQASFQKDTTPEKVALILSLEPVFAAIFGYLILGELLSNQSILGAALILAAVVGNEVWKLKRGQVQ